MYHLSSIPQAKMASSAQPWLASDVFPLAPGAPYGYRQGKKLVPCSFSELDEAVRGDLNRQIGLVWTPLQPRLTPPEEVPFLAEALAEGERRRSRQQLRTGLLQLLLWGVLAGFVFFSSESAPPAYLLYLFTFGIIPLAEHSWTLYQMRRGRWAVPGPDEGRFRAWLATRPERWSLALLGCVLAVGLVQLYVAYSHFFDEGWSTVAAAGLVKPAVWSGELWRLLTGPLLHGNPIHFVFNAIALLILGKLVETLISRGALALTFLLSAIAGSLFSLILLPQPSVGASGGIMGLLGLLILLGWQRRGQLPPFFLRSLVTGAVLIGLTGLVAFAVIDNPAHLGGFLAGLGLGRLLLAPGTAIPAATRVPLDRAGWVALGAIVVFSLIAILAILHLPPLW